MAVVNRAATAVWALAALIGGPAGAQELAVTRVRLDSLSQLETLARQGFEVSGVIQEGDALLALIVATETQRLALDLAGLPAAAVAAPAGPGAVNFQDFPAIQAALGALVAGGRPVTLDTIGLSWEGRPVVAAKIGPPGDAPDRPNVLYIGTHHAREWIAAAMAVRLIAYLADSLPATPAGAALLASRDVWVVPVLNPDGYQYTFDVERLWRKNRRPNDDGSFGVDLNRNYPGFWGYDDLGSSAATGAETYRGPAATSEPEIQALVAFHTAHPPDVAISYHSYTGLILYPYGYASGALAPDAPAFASLAGTALSPAIVDRLAETSRPMYFPGPAWMLYPTNGEYTEWAYRAHGTVAYTVELTAGCCVAGQGYGFLFPDDEAAIAGVFSDNLPFALDLLRRADAILPGAAPAAAQVESVWPEIRLSAPAAGATRTVEVRAGGDRVPRALVADTLDRGRFLWRWRGPLGVEPARAEVRVPELGLRVGVVMDEGGERETSGWTGWARDSTGAIEGTRYFRSAGDTLVSPEIAAPGVTDAWLVFWTRHFGSLFLPDRFGLVEMSRDRGSTWTPLARIEGAAPAWYPVRLYLGEADGVRVRFVPNGFSWQVDAIHAIGTPTTREIEMAQGTLGVSENPVRSDRVFVTWAPAAGDARLSVFTFGGRLVHRAAVPGPAGVTSWDVTNTAGERVANGAYLVVLEVGTEVLRKRLFVARSP